MDPKDSESSADESPDQAARAARDAEDRDVTGIKIPPPVFFLFTVVIAEIAQVFILSFRHGLGTLGVIIGLALIVFSVFLAYRAINEFWRAKTPLDVRQRSETLVTTGPFRYSRNPIYLAAGLLQAGIGMLLDRPWIVVGVLPALILVQIFAIAREEPYLLRRFGDDYRTYKSRVRRWI